MEPGPSVLLLSVPLDILFHFRPADAIPIFIKLNKDKKEFSP